MVRMMMTTRSVGEVSSKYGYQPEKFTEDIQRKAEESEKLYNEFTKKQSGTLKVCGSFQRNYVLILGGN